MYFSLDCLFEMPLRFHEYLKNACLFSLILSLVYSWRSFSITHLAVFSKANGEWHLFPTWFFPCHHSFGQGFFKPVVFFMVSLGPMLGVSNALLSIPHGFFPASTILCRVFLSQRFSLWLYMRRLFGAGVRCNLLFMVSRSCCSFSLWCLATVIGTMLLYYYRHVKAFNTRNKLRFIFMSHAVNTWILIASRAQSSK
ncbi:hypothetical protein FB192DRAFT_1370845 [Mucor lusitanicus]|uniref:Uncharacterized protein n=1 Tax=Mucor circinelloides f. lusitanicus TaxID=29924 RepID=A0A8H4BM69_MUCCL|nr:hypothetical protein FB192DRAFT_1370845 [Mucor lusitanicus]